jgi:hypothetical protein
MEVVAVYDVLANDVAGMNLSPPAAAHLSSTGCVTAKNAQGEGQMASHSGGV